MCFAQVRESSKAYGFLVVDPRCADANVTYYVRGVSLGTPLTSFRASNSKARFSCLTTNHSPTVAVALVKKRLSNVFLLRASEDDRLGMIVAKRGMTV